MEEQAPPVPTSRISVRKAIEVIQTFDDYKRWLLTEIGFGGILKLPMLQKLNLKFSAWTMSKFFAEDIHKVFGIPCGHRNVKGRDGFIKPEAVTFIKRTLGMDRTGVHSLRAAEEFIEKDCFQIAFVIFVMGHVPAPRTKHDYGTIDYWGALANTENITQYNWCEFVPEFLLEAVRRLKNDMTANNHSTNLVGCHLFLQIFFLDNVDLGIFNKKHNVLPRISDFDQNSLKNMITMATDIGKGPTSYVKCMGRDELTIILKEQNARCQREINTARSNLQADMIKFVDKLMASISKRCICCAARGFSDCPARAIDTCQVDTLTTPCGPKIPGVRLDMSACKGSWSLFLAISLLSSVLTVYNEFFTLPLIHLLRHSQLHFAGANSTSKPTSDERSDRQQNKRVHIDEEAVASMTSQIIHFARQTLQAISELFIDLPNDGSTTVFGQKSDGLPGRKYVFKAGFQTDPWIRGVVPCPPQAYVSEQLEVFFATALATELSRNFLVHENPRFLWITGLELKQQLVEDELIDHEMMSVIIRRYSQSDQEADKHSPYLTWRHPLEPEFSTLVLSDHDYIHTLSIQKALSAAGLEYDITSAQLFFTPVSRPEGWIIIFWDMVTRTIFVVDPMYSKKSQPLTTQHRDEILAWKLHGALFSCVNEYYAGWLVSKDRWTIQFPALADSIFSRKETGACVVFITRHFDGKKLKIPLTKHTMSKAKREMLHECMKLQGNFSPHARDALWRLLAPSDSIFEAE
ncbi:hypothetical protein VPH35_012832 [Triticum aestivum]